MAWDRVRIDLEELERKAEAALMSHPTDPWLWTGGQLDCYASVFRPPVALALIARIRELEAALTSVCDPSGADADHWRRVSDARGALGKEGA